MLPKIAVNGLDREVIIVQGGMGAGISLAPLAGAVAKRGGVGTVSFVALDRFVERRTGLKVGHREAARLETEEARRLSGNCGAIAINCMALVEKTYALSVLGAIDGGVDAVIVGAGLPMTLPEIAGSAPAALIPIVSSGRALELICRRWSRYGRMPDAVVLEGPMAGGHLGFKAEDVFKPEFQLEAIFGSVKEAAEKNGNFPVIVAGGIYTHEDIVRWVNAGADGVQIGTRFAATNESGASQAFKNAIVAAREEDIEIAHPGSPAGMPFRVIRTSPAYEQALVHGRALLCDKQYLLHKGADGRLSCPALDGHECFCICNALLAAANCNNAAELPIFTVGMNAARVDRILSVNELMDELTGTTPGKISNLDRASFFIQKTEPVSLVGDTISTQYLFLHFVDRFLWRIMDDRLHGTAAITVPARHKMDVQMVHFLPARPSLVYADRNTIGMKSVHEQCRCFFHGGKKRRYFIIRKRGKRRGMISRDDHRMSFRPRHDIEKCHRMIIFVHDFRRERFRRNFTKKTIGVLYGHVFSRFFISSATFSIKTDSCVPAARSRTITLFS